LDAAPSTAVGGETDPWKKALRIERWVHDNAPRMAAHVFLTGGAALDYAAGAASLTPPWMIRLELEWLYRLWREPRRLFTRYVLGNPEFLLRVFAERARRLVRRAGAS